MNRNTDPSFQGVFSLMLTPFTENGEIDWKIYDAYVDWQLSAQPHGLFAVCGTSEMKWLTLQERLALAKRTVDRAGNIPVVATANLEQNLEDHLEEIQRMQETGVSGIVLVPPSGLGEDQNKLLEYFARLASFAECPVLLYEWPQSTPYEIAPEVWEELSLEYGVKGIKDTTCTLEGIKAKIAKNEHATVFQANAPYMLDALKTGAKGIMAVTSSALNEFVVTYWNEVKKDPNAYKAKTFQQYLVFLDSVLRFAYPATAKYLARLQGIDMNLYCRWPVELKSEAKKAITIYYQAYQNIIKIV